MWLKRAHVTNFRSLRDLTLAFSPGVNAFIGENGTGKSNLTRALLKLLGPTYPGGRSFGVDDHYLRDPSNEIGIRLTFEDSGRERELSWGSSSGQGSRLLLDGRGVKDAERLQFCPIHFPADREVSEAPGQNTWNPFGRILSELGEMVKRNPGFIEGFQTKVSDLNSYLDAAREYAAFKRALSRYSRDHLGVRGDGIRVELGLVDPEQVLRTLRVFETTAAAQYNVADGGQGVQSSVTMAALRAFAEVCGGRLFIVADEPEAYLHPLAQRALCSVFERLAETGTQILLTTHSPHFISVNQLTGLHKVWMEDNATRVLPFNVDRIITQQADRGVTPEPGEGIIARLSRALTLESREGLFAQLVVLCEGETESMSLPQWAEGLGHGLARDGVAVVHAGGKFSMIRLAEFYSSLEIPLFLVFDSDSGERDPAKRAEHARHNKWLLAKAGGLSVDFPATSLGPSHAVFDPNFEQVLRDEPNYSAAEQTVDSELGLRPDSSKGIRARFVALNFMERSLTAPTAIREVVEAIVARRGAVAPAAS